MRMADIVATINEDLTLDLAIPRLLTMKLHQIGVGKKVRLDVKRWQKPRSCNQNRLQRLWLLEAAEQLHEYTPEEYRGYCKLHIGVPILLNEDGDFRAKYEAVIAPLPYVTKMELMMLPYDFPVTRLMNTDQKRRYLDRVYQHFTGLGAVLTEPTKKRDQ